jgi:tetratricopeptide (TPR) repeat protein
MVTLQLIQVGKAITADRFSYLPSLGLALFLVVLIEKISLRNKFIEKIRSGLVIFYCLVLAFSTINQNKIWANNMKLYNSILNRYPNVAVILNNRAIQKVENGDQDGALKDYSEAIRSDSTYQIAYENRANLFSNLNRLEEAFHDYGQSIRLKPTAKAFQNRALLHIKRNNFTAAISDLNQAIIIDSNYSLAFKNRGMAYILTGQKALGCADLQKAARLGKEDAPMLIERFCR